APSARGLARVSVLPCIGPCSNGPPTVTPLPPVSATFVRPSSPAPVPQSELANGNVVGSLGPFGAMAYWALSRGHVPVTRLSTRSEKAWPTSSPTDGPRSSWCWLWLTVSPLPSVGK